MHWCLGMYASGSTWVFNVAVRIGAALTPGMPPVGRYIASFKELDTDPSVINHSVIKTHDIDDASAEQVGRLASSLLISIRDPRDCVTSLMLYQGYPLAQAVGATDASARLCARFATDPRTLLLRYEDRFIGEPTTLDRIAATFGGGLSDADRTRILSEHSRSAVEARIAALASLPAAIHDARTGDIVDPATQWHRHHANRSGEVGRWRHLLTLADAVIVEQRLGNWMHQFGYTAEVAPHIRAVGMQPVRL